MKKIDAIKIQPKHTFPYWIAPLSSSTNHHIRKPFLCVTINSNSFYPSLYKPQTLPHRAGTSTRKPRLNSALVAQQAATLPGAPTTSTSTAAPMANGSSTGGSGGNHHHARPVKVARSKAKHKKYPARLTNVDRSTAQTREVTVNSVTVVITEYKPKAKPTRRESSEQSLSESNDSRS